MDGFFAGANSARGFINFFSDICASYKRIYILKGGSGCGKSSFMKSIASKAEARGDDVQRIYCSSDPQSLDGVLLPAQSVAVVDGTAPHTMEPRMAGAADVLVDLGEFWDKEMLRARRDEIFVETQAKANCYRRAYALLAGAGQFRKVALDIRRFALKREKLRAFAARRVLPAEKAPLRKHVALRCAFNGDGLCATGTDGIAVYDPFDMADEFFNTVIDLLGTNGGDVQISYDPLDTTRLDALFFRNGIGYYKTDRRCDGCINMERFVDRAVLADARSKLRLLEKAKNSLISSAQAELAQARRHHEALEKIYTPTVDFSLVDARRGSVEKDIFG